jgi:hypothetical protein
MRREERGGPQPRCRKLTALLTGRAVARKTTAGKRIAHVKSGGQMDRPLGRTLFSTDVHIGERAVARQLRNFWCLFSA